MVDFKKISSGYVPFCTDCGKHFGVAITDEERFLFTETCPKCFPEIGRKTQTNAAKRQRGLDILRMLNGANYSELQKYGDVLNKLGFRQMSKVKDKESNTTTIIYGNGLDTCMIKLNGCYMKSTRTIKKIKEFDIEKFFAIYFEKGKESALRFAGCSAYTAYKYLHSQGWICKKGSQSSAWCKGDKAFCVWDARKKVKNKTVVDS